MGTTCPSRSELSSSNVEMTTCPTSNLRSLKAAAVAEQCGPAKPQGPQNPITWSPGMVSSSSSSSGEHISSTTANPSSSSDANTSSTTASSNSSSDANTSSTTASSSSSSDAN